MGQQPTLCLQLKINDHKDFNGHFCTKIVSNVYIKRLYGRKSLMQFDLAQKNPWHFDFFTMGQFFLTNLASFGDVNAPQIF